MISAMSAATIARSRQRPALRLTPSTSQAFSHALPWLLCSVAMTMAALIGQVPPWTLLVFALCVGWRFLIERRRWPLPNFFLRLLVFAPMALAVLWTYGSHPNAEAMLTFLVALISLKILELRSPRDFTVVGLLGYFMALSAFFYNQSLTVSLYLGVALLANTVALVRGHSGGGQGQAPASVRLAVAMILQAMPLVVLIFLIFPRVQGSFLRRFGGDPQGLTGMSEHLHPGSFSAIAQSTDPVFRVKIDASGGSVPASQLYWRGLVMDICEHGLSWRSLEAAPAESQQLTISPVPSVQRPLQQITLKPQGERWLFALDRPVEARATGGARLVLTNAATLRSSTPVVSGLNYTAVSDLDAASVAVLTPERKRFNTSLPGDISPRVLALAQSWRKQARNEEDLLRIALQYFRDGHYTYTLNPGQLPAESALDTFLFQTKTGFCEHYAAAFCVLMRAAGMPARIVAGYQGGEYNNWGGHYVVRQSDAHAWAEVWRDGHGWQRADPTAMVAPDRVSFGADDYSSLMSEGPLTEESRLDRLRRLHAPSTLRWLAHNALLAWDGVDQQWNSIVLGYDQEQQWVFLQKLGLGDLDWVGGTTLTMGAVFTLLALGALCYRLLERRGAPESSDRAQRAYRRFCRRLSRAGVPPRQVGEGPLDFSRRAVAALPLSEADIRQITSQYIALRYGPARSLGGQVDPATQFRASVSAFRPQRTPA